MKDWYFHFVYTANANPENFHSIFKSFYVTEGDDPRCHQPDTSGSHWSLRLSNKRSYGDVRKKLAEMRVYETNRSK